MSIFTYIKLQVLCVCIHIHWYRVFSFTNTCKALVEIDGYIDGPINDHWRSSMLVQFINRSKECIGGHRWVYRWTHRGPSTDIDVRQLHQQVDIIGIEGNINEPINDLNVLQLPNCTKFKSCLLNKRYI